MNFTEIFGPASDRRLPLLAAAAAIFGLGLLGGMRISDSRIEQIEKRTAEVKAEAEIRRTAAIEKEREAERFKEKIAFLERTLEEREETGRRQDDEIKKISSVAGDLRADVRRLRGVSRIESTVSGLCARLSEIGHPCE